MAFNNASIPKLPGMQIDAPIMSSRTRPQTLVYKNGFSFQREDIMAKFAEQTGTPYPAGDMGSLAPMQTFGGATTKAGGQPMTTGADQTSVPQWVAYDRQVLRFYGYFKESVTDSATENQRIRKCVLFYYLVDDSIYVAEPKTPNSGLPQGVFLMKRKVSREDGSFVHWQDFSVGAVLTLYARSFFITGADPFTRQFFSKNGLDLLPDQPTPDGPLEILNASLKSTRTLGPPKARTDAMARFTEAKLGKASNALTETETLGQFLANDGKVLRFYCLWDTRGAVPNGERRLYSLNYFLADDTVEVLETKDTAGGRDPWSRMLSRCKLPSVQLSFSQPNKSYPSVSWKDLRVGQTLGVYGRDFLVYDADPFTKAWYAKQGIDQTNTLDVTENKPPRGKPDLPPYNGYGLLADSAQNCVSLLPKPPKADFVKLMSNDKKVLRFRARLIEGENVPRLTQADLERSFIVQFFMSDDTLSVFEPAARNTGFPGGKFLERGIVTKDGDPTGERYKSGDFAVGVVVRVYNRLFELVEADGFSLTFMEALPDVFPDSDLDTVVAQIRGSADGEALRSLLEAAGATIAPTTLKEVLGACGVRISQQGLITICRQWSAEGSSSVPCAELSSLIFS